jgi:hypothetical protein
MGSSSKRRRGARPTGAVALIVCLVITSVAVATAPGVGGALDPADLAEFSGFQPLTPQRVLDTRIGTGSPALPLGPGSTRLLMVTGTAGVPASGVGAVVLNLTGTQPTDETFITVWPSDEDRPLASNLNLQRDDTRPNLVVVPVGGGGAISFFNNRGFTHLIADVVGWYPDGPGFTPLTPGRLVDTREGTGAPMAPVAAGGAIDVQVAGEAGIPASGVGAVVLNVTGTQPTADTFLTAWPTGDARPLSSNLNLVPGQTAPNLVMVKVGDGGGVSLFNNLGSTHVVVDVLGWYPTTGPDFEGLVPSRLLDTRLPWPGTPVSEAGSIEVSVLGVGGVPDHGVGAVVLNVTGTLPTADTFSTAWPTGEPRPLASNLNLAPGETAPNLVIAKVGANGMITLYNNLGATHFIVDVMGWMPSPVNLDAETAARCEFLDPSECLLVWPSDHLTVDDPTTDTGRRLNLHASSLPRNTSGVPIDPTEFNRSDGFSPGTMVIARVPGIDLVQTGAPSLLDLSESLEPDSPMVIIDAASGEQHPIWAELDPDSPLAETRALTLRPGVNFEEGHRYVVALRRLEDSAGDVIPANPVFRAYRDGIDTDVPAVEARRPAMESIFETLDDAGVERDDLFLAWDFTVASERGLAERMLHIRDDAFADLGAGSPEVNITEVVEPTITDDPLIARRVEGTVQVPLYLTGTGATGSTFNWGGSGLPERNGAASITANFSCRIPRSASAANPARISVYGHGLLGSRSEVNAGNVRAFANEHNIVFCATDWIGMANEDIPTVVNILNDISRFPQLADRVQQGILNTLFLGRAMKHAAGLASHAAFIDGGTPLIDNAELYFDGNSQGAIIGGAATAVAQDWTRAVLGVPGMNYSLLLRRSSDWPLYASILDGAYPDRMDQTLILAMIQTQWDRAETNGYAHHLTDDPYPGTPEHQVLLHVAFADFQVSMWSAEIEARTMGASIRQPALAPGRHPDTNPYFGLPAVPDGGGFTGSVLVYWDSGTPPPPTIERPPFEGSDPHSKPRAQPAARTQKSAFFDGMFLEVCGTDPCLAP